MHVLGNDYWIYASSLSCFTAMHKHDCSTCLDSLAKQFFFNLLQQNTLNTIYLGYISYNKDYCKASNELELKSFSFNINYDSMASVVVMYG